MLGFRCFERHGGLVRGLFVGVVLGAGGCLHGGRRGEGLLEGRRTLGGLMLDDIDTEKRAGGPEDGQARAATASVLDRGRLESGVGVGSKLLPDGGKVALEGRERRRLAPVVLGLGS
ncbi:MAG: hypothetical protein AAFY58_05790 [Planctomycetota bacterium]